MEHLDNRVRYTKVVLQQALLKILQSKHIDKITVKELCEEAKVNRGTFYLHYSTPNDILKEIEQQFVDENMAMFNPYFNGGQNIMHMDGLFAGMFKDRELVRIIMGKNGNSKFLERVKETIRPYIVQGWMVEYPHYRREDLEYAFEYIFTGSTNLILSWIENSKGLTTEDLARRLDRLGHYSLLSITEFR